MRRWETLVALGAVILSSVSALPVRGRLWYAAGAIALLAVVGLSRLRTAMTVKKPASGFDAAERARAIREARDRRNS
jgi:hypothetical protein